MAAAILFTAILCIPLNPREVSNSQPFLHQR